jgi:hypothetical protein
LLPELIGNGERPGQNFCEGFNQPVEGKQRVSTQEKASIVRKSQAHTMTLRLLRAHLGEMTIPQMFSTVVSEHQFCWLQIYEFFLALTGVIPKATEPF